MKTSLKTLVRAISPFTGAKGPAKPEQGATTKDFSEYHWDLTKVDMEAMLTSFYKIYNPERVTSVNEILHQYDGDEIIMLQQLSERYNLSEADIQRFLNDAPLGKKDRFGNWMRKGSDGSVTFSEAGAEKEKKLEYGTYTWDLVSVDLAKALKLLYKKHNPEKTPNVASLQNKSTADRILLLQQLCKRHNLSQGDMQEFLDRARVKDDRSAASSSSVNSAVRIPISTLSNGGSGPKASAPGDDSSVRSRGRDSAAKSSAGANSATNDTAQALLSTLQKQKSTSQLSATADSVNDPPSLITGGLQRQGSLPFWQNSFPTPFSSPPPPPPPPPAAPTSALSGILSAMKGSTSPISDVGSVNSSVTAPSQLTTGSRSKLGAAVAARSASANSVSSARPQRAPSPSPSILTTSSIGSASVGRNRARDAMRDAAGIHAPEANAAAGRSTGSRPRSTGTASSTAGDGANGVASTAAARPAEVLALQKELSECRAQISGMQRDAQALQKALQDSRQRQNDAESTISGLSSHQQQLEQVPVLLQEVSMLGAALKQQEDREAALKRQYTQVKQQVQAAQEKTAQAERREAEARADYRDVLRLVDIMSASPAGIKAVLEAYLKRLGEATNNVTVKFGIGTDGRQIPISERISLALQLKRDQDRAASKGASTSGRRSAAEDDAGTPVDDEDGSREGGSRLGRHDRQNSSPPRDSRGGALQTRQQDNFEMFRSKIAQARQQRGAPAGGTSAGSRTTNAAPSESVPDAEEEGGDFADYASPDVSRRKGKGQTASARSASASQNEDAGAGDRDEVPSTLAGNIASDWVECLDPRSRRKYYYSAELKTSTWTKPANLSPERSRPATPAAASSAALPSMSSGVPSRYASPIGPAAARQAWGDSSVVANSKPAGSGSSDGGMFSSMRAASPYSAGSFTSSHSDYSAIFTSPAKGLAGSSTSISAGRPVTSGSTAPTGTAPSSRTSSPAASLHTRAIRSNSPAAGADKSDWVVAVDPRSQKKYWYNRQTKVSTWRQPAELII